jgi:hypothetical protein
MLEELPGGVRELLDANAAEPGCESFDGFLEADVRVLPAEDTAELRAKWGR